MLISNLIFVALSLGGGAHAFAIPADQSANIDWKELQWDISKIHSGKPIDTGRGDEILIPQLANCSLTRHNGSIVYKIPTGGYDISEELFGKLNGKKLESSLDKRQCNSDNPCECGTHRTWQLIDVSWSKFLGETKVMSSPLCGPGSISNTFTATYSYSVSTTITTGAGPVASVWKGIDISVGFSYTWGNAVATGYSATCDASHPCIATFRPYIGQVKGRARWTDLSNSGNKLCGTGIAGNVEIHLPATERGCNNDKCGAEAACVKFPKSGTLCISTNAKCKTRLVQQGDTCAKVADANKSTWTQVATWNRDFGSDCKRIGEFVGGLVCISTPGGDWKNPSPSAATPTPSVTLPPFYGVDASLIPQPTFSGMINGSDIWTYKLAEGTRLDCDKYINVTDVGTSTGCAAVAQGYGITVDQLVNWNPSLSSSCVLNNDLTYCVQTSILHVANVTQYCTYEDQPSFGQTCDEFLQAWDLDYETFEAFNPGLGAKCDRWKLGHSYFAKAMHFRQPGIVKNCNKWDMANTTNYLENPCQIFEDKYGLLHARFVAWNPMVQQDCETSIMNRQMIIY
ncbi:predicted protein [Pyrenophora tritici-repentis Pt-1C-BFP]|uniref:LysM domain-containing protein n=1 Tax=Pyrenophora tritici-repentis (strain Pt-1C-BFP) TaxID=426418 RepID=B2W4Y0_PYRTR|nr:uncharacterized protein PTRG_04680 [Pyrenophora tritici-repentis Pt-1C-BFP]EDU47587.1 predicted protein [Pyrenophora tritici-repentis Pt-1C-BFP]